MGDMRTVHGAAMSGLGQRAGELLGGVGAIVLATAAFAVFAVLMCVVVVLVT